MNKDNFIQNILDKFLALKKEKQSSQLNNFWDKVSNDLQENSDDIKLSQKLENTFSTIQKEEKEKKQDNHLQELINKLDYSESTNIFSKERSTLGKVLLKIAAVFIPVALVTTLMVLYLSEKKSTSDYQVVSTQKGSKTKIVMEDGTAIWLNAESEIRYPSSFKNKDKRVVNLKGEAYFDVAKNKKKPFEVYTFGYKIHVLGTSFNVKAYPEQETFETTLEEGKIDIERVTEINESKKSKKITLVPNQTIVLYKEKQMELTKNSDNIAEIKENMLTVSPIKGEIIESNDLSEYTSWKENELVFKSKSLGELIPDLERWFNIDISVQEDSLNQITCTGNFHNETVEQVIRALCIASKINYEIDKNKVTLKANLNTIN